MLLLSLNKACTTKQQKQNVTLMQPKGSLVGSCSKTVPSRREMGVTVSITCGCVCRRAVVRSFGRSRVEARGPQKEPNKLRTTKLPSASNASASASSVHSFPFATRVTRKKTVCFVVQGRIISPPAVTKLLPVNTYGYDVTYCSKTLTSSE